MPPLAQPPKSVWGPDVSKWQNKVDWKAAVKAGATFGIAKATEGKTVVDRQFANNWVGMKKAGLKVRGAYHYGHLDTDPLIQAHNFISAIVDNGGFAAGDFVVLDIEDVCLPSKLVSKAKAAQWVADFLAKVEVLSGLPRDRVFVYTGAWWWDKRTGGSSIAGEYPLWVACYTSRVIMPKGWDTWSMWQYSSTQVIPGFGKVDNSVWNGTKASLYKQMGVPSSTPAPVPPKPPVTPPSKPPVTPPAPKPPVVTPKPPKPPVKPTKPPVTTKPPASKTPSVSVKDVQPGKRNKSVTIVQRALVAEKMLKAGTAKAGTFDAVTSKAYKKWQTACGYKPPLADGSPGFQTLDKLGKKTKLFKAVK